MGNAIKISLFLVVAWAGSVLAEEKQYNPCEPGPNYNASDCLKWLQRNTGGLNIKFNGFVPTIKTCMCGPTSIKSRIDHLDVVQLKPRYNFSGDIISKTMGERPIYISGINGEFNKFVTIDRFDITNIEVLKDGIYFTMHYHCMQTPEFVAQVNEIKAATSKNAVCPK